MRQKEPMKSLLNSIHGDFEVLEYIGNRKYKCRCTKCGHTIESFSTNINDRLLCQQCKPGYTKSLIGQQFGLLRVTEYNKETKKWICECTKCGKSTEVRSNNLKNQNTGSCGRCKYIEQAKNDVVGGTKLSQLSRKINQNNTSGFSGVSWNRRKNKWAAAITFRGKHYFLGYHENKDFAAKIVEEARAHLTSEFLDWYEQYKAENNKL